jgi:kinesin family protein 2/24
MEAMEAQREARRQAMQERKLRRLEETERNAAEGNPGDVDFIGLVRAWRLENASGAVPLPPPPLLPPPTFATQPSPLPPPPPRICVAVRKRPVSDKERERSDHDSVTVLHPRVWVHAAKFRVDGIRKYLDHTAFSFDYAFDESADTSDVYRLAALPLLRFVVQSRGRATVFSYGQTGSGKTHTMQGIQALLSRDLFNLIGTLDEDVAVSLSMYELYGGSLHDLLNDRRRLKVLEDGRGEINVAGLAERPVPDVDTFQSVLEEGNAARTTHATQANDASSRSHAICTILLRSSAASSSSSSTSTNQSNKLLGKLALVDLAGSERGNDTTSHNAQRRAESADINTSLLALKECIRAMGASGDESSHCNGSKKPHVPYRQSKLTLILKDCLVSTDARTAMIATVSPGASSVDHTLNTLRYADRVKDRPASSSSSSSLILRGGQQPNRSKTPPPNPRSKPPSKATAAGLTSPPPSSAGRSPVGHPKPKPRMVPQSASSSPLQSTLGTHSPLRRHPEPTPTTLPASMLMMSPAAGYSAVDHDLGRIAASSSDESLLIVPAESSASSHHEANNGGAAFPSRNIGDGVARDYDDDYDDDGEDKKEDDEGLLEGGSVAMGLCDTDPAKPLSGPLGDHVSNEKGGGCGESEAGSDLDFIHQEEEDILNVHMSNIQENAELLGLEGSLLQDVQRDGASWDEVEKYARTLEAILDRREGMIHEMQARVDAFEPHLLRPRRQPRD